MILRITVITALCICSAQAVLNKELKRREAFDSYGPPPRPSPQYGPPHREPHREYGVPQQIPFQEYGPPALKYGPPKLNFVSSSSGSSSGGLYEQIKNYFGVPKPFYGPPHKPAQNYGPPPQPQPQYGPPKPPPNYGPPPPAHKPQQSYGPPPKLIYGPPKPAQNYGPPPKQSYGPPPKQSYGPPHQPQSLPLTLPSVAFRPEHEPASSYGPPPSGPIHQPKPAYGPPPPNYGPPPPPPLNYGPPPLPQLPPNLHPPNFNRGPESTIVIGGGHQHHHSGGPVKQVQIQIDSAGHTHSVSGSQAPFHTACDGWKPIPAPIGTYVEHNNIETQGGYSNVQHGFGNTGSFTTQYSSSAQNNGGSFLDSLTDEQLVAIALQTDVPNGGTNVLGSSSGHTSNFNSNHNLNSIESEALQIGLGALDDSYSQPPSDSIAPGSAHAQKFNGHSDSYGAPPSGIPQHSQTQNTFIVEEQHQHSSPPVGVQPRQPLAYRPPVPQGLLESIGASVNHFDQFGVKPVLEPPTYIPPAVNEIPNSGPGNLNNEYGAPLLPQALPLIGQPPQEIVEQQLPKARPHQHFVQGPPQVNYLPPKANVQQQYVPPPPPPTPQNQYLPSLQEQRPPITHLHPVAEPPNQQYLPPLSFPQGSNSLGSYQQQNSAFTSLGSASAVNEQFIHTQGLPRQQGTQFNHVHDCGHGPNLIGGNFQVQQLQQLQGQQQQQQHQYASSGSANAYNAITQSIPVAETHQQFVEQPSGTYASSYSGHDHEGYASQQSTVTRLPDGTNPEDLRVLDGLNVISAQKSESIDINSNQQAYRNQQPQFQLELAEHPAQKQAEHDEILSQGLLQSILTAIEEPKAGQHLQSHYRLASNHNYEHIHDAQSRSDTAVHDDEDDKEHNKQPIAAEASEKHEVQLEADKHEAGVKAVIKEIEPIVPEEVPAE